MHGICCVGVLDISWRTLPPGGGPGEVRAGTGLDEGEEMLPRPPSHSHPADGLPLDGFDQGGGFQQED